MKNPLVTVLFLAILALTTAAQEKLTLQQAIQTALEKNIDVISAKNTSQIQEANVTARLPGRVKPCPTWFRVGCLVYPRGRPRPRPAMMPFWISVVPAATVSAEANR